MSIVAGTPQPDQAALFNQLAQECFAADGVAPFSEQTLLDIAAGAESSRVWTLGDPVVGVAHSGRTGDVELAVRPEARGKGAGTELLRTVLDAGETAVWAHGDLPAAQELAASSQLYPGRTLLVLERPVTEENPAPALWTLPGIVLAPVDPAADMEDIARLNAEAFADLPDQGQLTAEDLRERMEAPWFTPELLVTARCQGELVGFVWLKPNVLGGATAESGAGSESGAAEVNAASDPGAASEPSEANVLELYVLAVAPEHRGKGIGKLLTAWALVTTGSRGFSRCILYVDAANSAAVHVYGKAGFTQAERHVRYELQPEPAVSATRARLAAREGASAVEPTPHETFLQAVRLGSPVSTKSLTDMAKESRKLAKRSAKAPEESQLPEGRFADRELSWLAFNERVLEQAEDETLPLLERAWFLSIFSSNLDEFFMVRVAGLKRRIDTGIGVVAASGLTPRQVMKGIAERTHELTARQAKVYSEDIKPKLEGQGVFIRRWNELDAQVQQRFSKLFKDEIFPVLTPLAVDPSHPFPYISGLSLNLAVVLKDRRGSSAFARVKVPDLLPRFLMIGEDGTAYSPENVPVEAGSDIEFLPLEELIGHHLGELFPGMDVQSYATFRVTRNEDLEVEEDDAENLLTALERELLRRRFGPVVRLEVDEDMDDATLSFLQKEMSVSPSDTYRLPAPLDLQSLEQLHDLDRPGLKYPKYVPVTPTGLTDAESAKPADFFAKLRDHDVLLHHPYESFSTSVQQFIAQAAADPQVLAIKQTLYRTSGDSPIVNSLIRAARAGKQVLAIVEIKARFDEQRNIEWARKLERAGVHVVYGMIGLKTHCKLALVVRQESDGLRRYCHVGTGNYNPKTARGYEDLGLLTSNRDVGQDLTRLFNQLSGYSRQERFHRLLVAPTGIRSGLIDRIEREIENKNAGKPAWVKFKVNSIVDEATIDALYRASQAGVKVSIQVRGICALRAGIPGLSDNIKARSILGRYLEHSRIYAFCNDGDADVFIGSADLMHRNLDRRIEALIKITDPDMVDRLVELVDVATADTTSSWHLGPDGWVRHNLSPKGRPLVDIQELLMKQARSRVAGGD